MICTVAYHTLVHGESKDSWEQTQINYMFTNVPYSHAGQLHPMHRYAIFVSRIAIFMSLFQFPPFPSFAEMEMCGNILFHKIWPHILPSTVAIKRTELDIGSA